MIPIDVSATPLPLRGFDHQCRTRIVYGVNVLEQLGKLARELGGTRVLLVTDPGIVRAGHAARAARLLETAQLPVTLFDEARENPSTRCVDACVEVARRAGVDLIIGLGGGSSMDTAKGCNFILTNGGRMRDYWGVGKAAKPMLPLIAIPTTGGTGSECQSFALIADEVTHQKMACGDPKAAARIAILDPALTLSQPLRVTACSGIDAIAHAVESAVTRPRTVLSLLFARESFRLAMAGFPRVLKNPEDLEARGAMLLGAAWAGCAIENSMLGAAHSAANPLTAHHDIAHGQAVGLMLPHLVRFNAREPGIAEAYADLARAAQLGTAADEPAALAERLAGRLEELLEMAGLDRPLSSLGVRPENIAALAGEASRQWTAQFNPRPISAADFEVLYAGALDRRR
jgi:alcohol dehydrogenase